MTNSRVLVNDPFVNARKCAEFIKQRGYLLANSMGANVDYPVTYTEIGIIRRSPPHPVNLGVIKFNIPSFSGDFVAMLKELSNSRDWVLEVKGKKHLNSMTQLANELSETFDVRIDVKLVQEGTSSEHHPGWR